MRIDDATAARDGAIDNIALGIERLRGAAAQRDQIIAARASRVANVASHEAHLEQAANTLLRIYRDSNRTLRTKAEPRGFAIQFSFNDHLLERPAVQALLSASPPRHDAEALVAELDRLRTDVLNAYGAIIDAAPAGV
jgi:hypothetical protein